MWPPRVAGKYPLCLSAGVKSLIYVPCATLSEEGLKGSYRYVVASGFRSVPRDAPTGCRVIPVGVKSELWRVWETCWKTGNLSVEAGRSVDKMVVGYSSQPFHPSGLLTPEQARHSEVIGCFGPKSPEITCYWPNSSKRALWGIYRVKF